MRQAILRDTRACLLPPGDCRVGSQLRRVMWKCLSRGGGMQKGRQSHQNRHADKDCWGRITQSRALEQLVNKKAYPAKKRVIGF